ncbi:hypothetical protein M0R45_029665 [Rubus argutus]|uniref:Leucine-rich repeat-containing N-terminal plant-type domain-containing protein n=1 Tax=Rubus argutus TaxID=59490 RepID=A0AAW1WBD1_RUBAR
MAKQYQCVFFIAIFIGLLLASQAGAYTDPIDGSLLNLSLTGWRLDSGGPCDESWNGVSCSGSSVIYLKLHGLNLSGYITAGLYNLYNLQQLDISSNSIGGEIPYVLPPNATHMNLSHNLLSGPIGNVFTGLQNLREMDLSYNNFTGDLPPSFGSLTNLTGLYLQNNQLTGSVAYLAELPLTHLNLSHNLLSGPIGNGFTDVQNLRELDLSYNNFTGDVPTSFRSLTNLTGSIASLAELPPTDM